MSDVSRTRTPISTITAYIKATIQAANTSWIVREYPYPDLDNILQYLNTVAYNTGCVFISYNGCSYATLENPSPARRLSYRLVLVYQKYTDPSAGALYVQNMIETIISALDHQISSNVGYFIAKDNMNRISKNGNGVLSAIIDINAEDN